MTSAKLGAIVMSLLLIMYLVLVGTRAVEMIQSGVAAGVAMGSLLLVFPAIGAWLVIAELRFGLKIEALGKRIEQEGTWPQFAFELRPSGRVIRSSAEAVFDEYRLAAQAKPEDFHSWFNLGLAYDAAGDRRRARAAMRKALKLANAA